MPERFMSVTEAAAAMGISVTALYDRIRNGQVQAERVGKRVLLIPESEVERLRGAGKLKPGPKPSKPKEQT
jgi:excisionase family DNA binding protein